MDALQDLLSGVGAGGMIMSPSKYLLIYSTSATFAAVRDNYYITKIIVMFCQLTSAEDMIFRKYGNTMINILIKYSRNTLAL
jgi:hypothetical protein